MSEALPAAASTTVLRVVSIGWNAVVLTAHVGDVWHVRSCRVVLQRRRTAGSASKLAPPNEHYGCGRCQGHHRKDLCSASGGRCRGVRSLLASRGRCVVGPLACRAMGTFG